MIFLFIRWWCLAYTHAQRHHSSICICALVATRIPYMQFLAELAVHKMANEQSISIFPLNNQLIIRIQAHAFMHTHTHTIILAFDWLVLSHSLYAVYHLTVFSLERKLFLNGLNRCIRNDRRIHAFHCLSSVWFFVFFFIWLVRLFYALHCVTFTMFLSLGCLENGQHIFLHAMDYVHCHFDRVPMHTRAMRAISFLLLLLLLLLSISFLASNP